MDYVPAYNDDYANYCEQQDTQSLPQFDQAPINQKTAPRGDYYSIKVFSKRSAIEVKKDQTKKHFNTIRIEGALGENRQYDWRNKITIQLTKNDILSFMAVFLMIKPNVELKNYGENNDKMLTAKYQNETKNFFISLSQSGKKMVGVPIGMVDAIQIGQYCLEQYLNNFDNIQSDTVVNHLQRAVNIGW